MSLPLGRPQFLSKNMVPILVLSPEVLQFLAARLPVVDRVRLGMTCKSMRNVLLVDPEDSTYNTDQTYKGMTLKEAAHFGNLRQFKRSLHQFRSSPLNVNNQSEVFEAVDILAMNPRLTQAGATFLETEHSYAGVGPYSSVLFKKSWWDAVKANNVLLLRSLMAHDSTPSFPRRDESLGWGYYLMLAIANDAVDVVKYILPQRCIASKYPWAPAFSGCSIPTHPSMTGVLRIMSLRGDCNDEAAAIMDAEEITDQKLLVELSRLGWCRAVYDRVDFQQQFKLLDGAVSRGDKEFFMVLWEHSQGAFNHNRALLDTIDYLGLWEFKEFIQQHNVVVSQ